MWVSDIADRGYEVGTFKIGQTVYHIKEETHRFRFHKKCMYCDNTGRVLVKGKEFVCPNCNGSFETKEVIEKVVGEPDKVKSILSFKNRNKHLEVYTNDSSGYGWIICKQDNGENTNFDNYEEAQRVCDDYNKKNNVEPLLDEYKRQEIREGLNQ